MKYKFLALAPLLASSVPTAWAGCGGECDVSPPGLWIRFYCSTLNEWLEVDPITGSASYTPEQLIKKLSGKHCSPQPAKSPALTYVEKETISHSKAGELSTQVAMKVGEKDVAEVGLTTGAKSSNGWQWTTSLDTTTEYPSKTIPRARITFGFSTARRESGITKELDGGKAKLMGSNGFRITAWKRTISAANPQPVLRMGKMVRYTARRVQHLAGRLPTCMCTMPAKLNSSIGLAVLLMAGVAYADDEKVYAAALERTSGIQEERLPTAIADLEKVVGDRVPEGPYGLRALRKLYQLQWQAGRLQDAEKVSVRFLSSPKLTPTQRSTALYERSMILKDLGEDKLALRILQSLQKGPAAAGLPESMRTNVQRWSEELAVETGAATQKDQEQIVKRLKTVLQRLDFPDERQWLLASSDVERLNKIAPKKAVDLLKQAVAANPTSSYAPRGFLLAGTLEYGQMEDIPVPDLKRAQESFTVHDEAYWNIVYLIGLALAKNGQRGESIEPLRQVGYSDGSAEQRAAALRLLGYQYQELGMEAEARAAARDSALLGPEAAQLSKGVFPEYAKEFETNPKTDLKDLRYGGGIAVGAIIVVVSVGGLIWRRRFLRG